MKQPLVNERISPVKELARDSDKSAIDLHEPDKINFVTGIPQGYTGAKRVLLPDVNALAYMASNIQYALQCGYLNTFSSSLSTIIGGYPKNSIVAIIINSRLRKVISLIDNNTYNIESDSSLINNIFWAFCDEVSDELVPVFNGSSKKFTFDIPYSSTRQENVYLYTVEHDCIAVPYFEQFRTKGSSYTSSKKEGFFDLVIQAPADSEFYNSESTALNLRMINLIPLRDILLDGDTYRLPGFEEVHNGRPMFLKSGTILRYTNEPFSTFYRTGYGANGSDGCVFGKLNLITYELKSKV